MRATHIITACISGMIYALLTLMPAAHAQNYDFNEMAQAMDSLSLPLLNIEVGDQTINRDTYVEGMVTIATYDTTAHETATVQYGCQLRYRGTSAMLWEKKPYNLKLIDENGKKLEVPLLGMREDNTWILDAMAIDRMRMRNRVLFDIWNSFSKTPYDTKYDNRNGTEGRYVEVWINSEYRGLFCLSDKINRKLLNLKKAKEDDETGEVEVRGVLYKGNGFNYSRGGYLSNYTVMRTDTVVWNDYELQYPDDYPSEAAWRPLMNLIDSVGKVNDALFTQRYKDWFYVENLVDYWLFLQAFNIRDMPYKNTFLSTPNIQEGHRFMLTPWDLDSSLGRSWDGSKLDEMCNIGRMDSHVPFKVLRRLNLDGFNDSLASRWHELSVTKLHPDTLKQRLEDYAALLTQSGAWSREQKRWVGYIHPNVNEEITYIYNWYLANWAHMNEVFPAPPPPEYPVGDLNGDMQVNVSDINILVSAILGSYSAEDYPDYDISDDGTINVTDVNLVVSIVLNNTPPPPPPEE